jgi:putative ABC transport system permease protein
VLKGRLSNTLAAVSLRKGLVVFQFTISCLLIVASVVISNQMNFMRTTDLGFTKDQQIVIPMRNEAAKLNYAAMKNSLMQSNLIKSVGAAVYYPGIFNAEDGRFTREGKTADEAVNASTNRVDFDFLKTLDIKTLAGRSFSTDFQADTNTTSIIFNEKAIQKLGFATPAEAIGQKVSTNWTADVTIVGVVKDFHYEDLSEPIKPFGFTVSRQPFYNYLIAHANTADLNQIIKTAETTWQKLNPNEPFEYSFLDADFQKNYESESRLATIVNYFTLVAILISCLGLFGLATFSAEQRTKEIGVRKVLGASVGNIVGLLSKDFLKLVALSVVIASPIAWFVMNKWLQDFAYRSPISWTVFAITAAVALLIAFVTIGGQAIKAAVANPVKSLRTE